ncbi:hypothetical protein Ntsu_24700 [Nocardia sp. IFM 10818]
MHGREMRLPTRDNPTGIPHRFPIDGEIGAGRADIEFGPTEGNSARCFRADLGMRWSAGWCPGSTAMWPVAQPIR